MLLWVKICNIIGNTILKKSWKRMTTKAKSFTFNYYINAKIWVHWLVFMHRAWPDLIIFISSGFLKNWHSLRTTLYSIDPASWGPESIILSIAVFSAPEQIWNQPSTKTIKARGFSLQLQNFRWATKRHFVLW